MSEQENVICPFLTFQWYSATENAGASMCLVGFRRLRPKTNYKHRIQLIGEIMAESLKDMSIGDVGRVLGFDRIGLAYRKRLLSMGLTPGTEFSVIRYAPMGDPVEIKVRGFSLSLRKGEASALLIERL